MSSRFSFLPGPLTLEELSPLPSGLLEDLRRPVDALWEEARARRPGLFDGESFCLLEEPTQAAPTGILRGAFLPYRFVLARIRRPELFAEQSLYPLAVTGVVETDGRRLVGCRSDHSTQDPGCWELVPAGGIGPEARTSDGPSPMKQLGAELEEETSLTLGDLRSCTCIGLLVDARTGVCDLVYRARVDAEQVRRVRVPENANEHSQLRWVEHAPPHWLPKGASMSEASSFLWQVLATTS